MSHFDLYLLDSNGQPKGDAIKCTTTTAVILNSPLLMDSQQVTRLCEIARETPDYPVDLTAFIGRGELKRVAWQARIYWRATNSQNLLPSY